jgi:hypothetical protein
LGALWLLCRLYALLLRPLLLRLLGALWLLGRLYALLLGLLLRLLLLYLRAPRLRGGLSALWLLGGLYALLLGPLLILWSALRLLGRLRVLLLRRPTRLCFGRFALAFLLRVALPVQRTDRSKENEQGGGSYKLNESHKIISP